MTELTSGNPLPIVVLISGSGSNLQAIIDQIAKGVLPVDIRAVISNRADAYGLQRARTAGIDTTALSHRNFASRDDYDQALIRLIDGYRPALVVLAGFMRILTPGFVAHYHGRLLNIHPSLLPAYRGLNTHQRVLEAGDSEHGVSVHFVSEELDGGPVIIQSRLEVAEGDNAESLANRVQQREHVIYPLAIGWFADGRLQLTGAGAELDGVLLDRPVQYYPPESALAQQTP